MPVPGSGNISSSAKINKEGSIDTYYAPNIDTATPSFFLGIDGNNKMVKSVGGAQGIQGIQGFLGNQGIQGSTGAGDTL
jgi:hypothetical protein